MTPWIGSQLAAAGPDERLLDPASRRQWREETWERRCRELLAQLPAPAIADTRPSAAWKAQVAAALKHETDVTNAWLAQRLGLSTPAFASKQAARWRQTHHPKGKK